MYTDTTRPNHLAQEVIDNSVDEALAGYATTIRVPLHADGSLSVSDDGRGIDPSRTRNSGLANMAERARRHHGSFDADTGDGGVGTQIRWIAPLED